MIRASGASQRRDSLRSRMAFSTAASSLPRMRLTRLTTVATQALLAGGRGGAALIGRGGARSLRLGVLVTHGHPIFPSARSCAPTCRPGPGGRGSRPAIVTASGGRRKGAAGPLAAAAR